MPQAIQTEILQAVQTSRNSQANKMLQTESDKQPHNCPNNKQQHYHNWTNNNNINKS